jgi:1-acyl-sn-glycerol-3-phosphate acyltransferase
MAAAVVLLLAGTVIALGYSALPPAFRDRLVRGWSRAGLLAFGVRLRVIGEGRFAPPGAGVLVVVNHVSWLDIIVLNAIQPCRMVAKRELRDWFVIGRLATATGAVYIDRERLSTLPRTVGDLAAALRAGERVAVFPEGTVWCGRGLGRYRPASFQAALDAGVPVRPVVLRFRLGHGRDLTTAPAYVGKGTLWTSLRRVAALRGLVVEAVVLPELTAGDHADRRALASAAHAAASAAATAPA